MNKKILASIMVIGMLALAMGYGTYSYFSDTKTITGNTFTGGTIALSLYSPYTTPFSLTLAPGQKVTYYFDLSNTGSVTADHAEVWASNIWTNDGAFVNNIIVTVRDADGDIDDASTYTTADDAVWSGTLYQFERLYHGADNVLDAGHGVGWVYIDFYFEELATMQGKTVTFDLNFKLDQAPAVGTKEEASFETMGNAWVFQYTIPDRPLWKYYGQNVTVYYHSNNRWTVQVYPDGTVMQYLVQEDGYAEIYKYDSDITSGEYYGKTASEIGIDTSLLDNQTFYAREITYDENGDGGLNRASWDGIFFYFVTGYPSTLDFHDYHWDVGDIFHFHHLTVDGTVIDSQNWGP